MHLFPVFLPFYTGERQQQTKEQHWARFLPSSYLFDTDLLLTEPALAHWV